jgi:lambda family phage portal protein
MRRESKRSAAKRKLVQAETTALKSISLVGRDASGRFVALSGDTANVGASTRRRSMVSWRPFLGSARTDLDDYERGELVARSRDAFRNQLLPRAVLTRITSNVIGSGLRMQARPDKDVLGISKEEADELTAIIEREHKLWANNTACDAEWTLNFYQLQNLALLSQLMSGDVFTATPMVRRPGAVYETVLQMLESDRIDNPPYVTRSDNIVQGVQLDALGAPMRYYISNQHPADAIGAVRFAPVDVFGPRTGVRRVLHLFDKERPGQVRGAPILAPLLEPLKKLDCYGEAELTAAVVSALFTAFVTKAPEGLSGPLDGAGDGTTNEVALGNGAIVDLAPGEDIKFANPGRPNENYGPFFEEFARQAGAALELPMDELLLSYRDSYSAARAAMLQGWRMYKRRRANTAAMWCQPAHAVWFDEAVSKGRIPVKNYSDPARRIAYQTAKWSGPARGAIDELKEIQAAEKRVAVGVSTLEIETSELTGEDWYDVSRQRAIERKERNESGLSDPSDPKPNAAAQKTEKPDDVDAEQEA